MLIYWGILAWFVVGGIVLSQENSPKLHKFGFSAISCGVLTAVAGLRAGVGWDYTPYAIFYAQSTFFSKEEFMAQRMEKGFSTLAWVFSQYENNFKFFFWVLAIVVAVLITVIIYKNSSNFLLSFFAFVAFGMFYNSMNFERQMISALIVAYAFKYIKEQRPIRYFILILLATCFHFSAFIMLPFYFILQIPLNKIVVGIYSVIFAFIFINSKKIVDIVTAFVYKGYAGENVEMNVGIKIGIPIVFVLFFILVYVFYKPVIEKDKNNNMLFSSLYFTCIFEIIGTHHAVLSRLALHFMIPGTVLLISELDGVLRSKVRERLPNEPRAQWLVTALLIALMCGFNFYFLSTNYNGVVPYKTVM